MYGGFAVMKKLNTTILNFTVGILEHVDKDLEKLRDCPIYLDLVGFLPNYVASDVDSNHCCLADEIG